MKKWPGRILVASLLLLALAFGSAWWLLRGSLPQLDGGLSLAGLSAPASIQRDRLGVVTIEAADEADAMRALGYVHAQERYFEMDLMRRTAAGELAELFGPVAVDTDKEHRVHRFRARVMQNLDTIAGDKLPVLQAYVDGVNAGLANLKVRPWPYLLLRTEPEPWQLADTPLVGYAMYFDLQDSTNARELALWKLKPHVPPALFKLLNHDGSSWDAPLMGQPRGDAVLPTAEQLDLRKLPASKRPNADELAIPRELGSNSFAVSGALTSDGRAIVANDMHLALRAPNIWFRAQLRYADPRAPNGRVEVGGFTLPGLPAVVVGSNRHVAWGFTNSYIDTADWQVATCETGTPANLCRKIFRRSSAHYRERISVAGDSAVWLDVWERDGFPAVWDEQLGAARILHWSAHEFDALNLRLSEFAHVSGITQVIRSVQSIAIPQQNLVLAAETGDIGWLLTGRLNGMGIGQALPCCSAFIRDTLVRSVIADSRGPDGKWHGKTVGKISGYKQSYCTPGRTDFLPEASRPRVVDTSNDRLWTANNRILDGKALKQVGDGGYVLGARARQIRDALFAKNQFNEHDLLAIQLDDRSLFLRRWWQLLRDEAVRAKTPALRELADAAKTWQGRASTNSVSHRLVRAWRLAVHGRIADGLTAPARAALGKEFAMPGLPQLEGVAWPLVTQRPAHLLPRRFASWDALFEDAAKQVRSELAESGPLSERTWGEKNTAHICHPLAGALPAFAKGALCMPFEPLPGDTAMPRVQTPDMGASERMVVSPGHEEDGIIHMPGGQSGHPLSPFWGAGHDDWVHGRPTPYLPGKPQHTLRITPAP